MIGAYWNIELVELERQGVGSSAFRLEENGVPDYDELVVVTSDDGRAGAARRWCGRFLRGLRKGQDWAATDQAGAVEHLRRREPGPRPGHRQGAAARDAPSCSRPPTSRP